jgi:glycosyltransferase involved in cell wall biosynthesis
LGLKRATRVITVSQHSAADIVKHLNISPGVVRAIHHGLDREFILDDGHGVLTDGQSRLKLSRRNYVLMLGGDSHQKNPEGAIAAWAKVPESIKSKYRLKIVGFCGDDNSPLMKALRKHKLEDSVEVHGWITQNELVDSLRNAALFLYLSRYEGFGFPPLQAMASGTPVISTNRSSIPEVLGEVGLKYTPDDHDGIARGITEILTDESAWNEQVEEGIKRSQLFDWKKSAEAHLKVYEEVLGNA